MIDDDELSGELLDVSIDVGCRLYDRCVTVESFGRNVDNCGLLDACVGFKTHLKMARNGVKCHVDHPASHRLRVSARQHICLPLRLPGGPPHSPALQVQVSQTLHVIALRKLVVAAATRVPSPFRHHGGACTSSMRSIHKSGGKNAVREEG
jgi:hypothetical protein